MLQVVYNYFQEVFDQWSWQINLPLTACLFSAGLAIYYALSFEPKIIALLSGLLLLLSTLGLAAAIQSAPFIRYVLIVFIVITGALSLGRFHTMGIQGEMLTHSLPPVTLTGFVEAHERRADGSSRITLIDYQFDQVVNWRNTKRVRLYIRNSVESSLTNKVISVRVKLNPVPRPVYPGGFNYARSLYFQGVGAMGFALSSPVILDASEGSQAFKTIAYFAIMRAFVADKIHSLLPEKSAGIAIALLTGDKSGIPDEVSSAMRDAGLAHLLAISGLHMALVTGLVFGTARWIFALIPAIALNYNTKKIAAVIAAFAALGYLLLSGAALSTQRAFIMVSIVFLAIILNRQAITMRLVAIAAIIVLLIQPHAIFSVGFQMSFAAVIGLVYGYQQLRPYFQSLQNGANTWYQRLSLYVFGVICSTLIAEICIAPIALYHFHQIPVFGIVANVFAVPLTGLIIMPLGLLALILMPFDLADPLIRAMGYSIEVLIAVAQDVSSFTGAVLKIANISDMSFYGMVALALIIVSAVGWRTKVLFTAIGVLIVVLNNNPSPNLIIDETGTVIAAKVDSADTYLVNTIRSKKYTREQWGRRFAGEFVQTPNHISESEEAIFACDPQACRYSLKSSLKQTAWAKTPLGLAEECTRSEIIVYENYIPNGCGASVQIDYPVLRRNGAHAVWFEGAHTRILSVSEAIGDRPWAIALK